MSRFVLLALLLLAPLARAQQAQPLPVELEKLRPVVATRRAAYLAAVESRVHKQDEHSTLREKRIGLLDEQRTLEAEKPGFFRDRKLNDLRSEMARVSAEEAAALRKLQDLRGEEVVARVALIRALEALVLRALEVAERIAPHRAKDAKDRNDEALAAAREVDGLWARVEPAAVDELPKIDPTKIEDDQLTRIIATYQEYADRAEGRATDLLPDQATLGRRARGIEELIKKGFAAPDLPQRLERAREHLGRVAGFIERENQRAADYKQRIAALEKERANRAIRRGAVGPEVPR